jgi:hypothetical protein
VTARRLVIWALATFHAAAFVIAALLLLYPRGRFGDTLASLNTLLGFGLYIALWVTTVVTTRGALRGLDPLTASMGREFPRRAIRWGAANGVAFLVMLAVPLIVGSIAAAPAGANPLSSLPFVVVVAPIALSVAAAVGGLIGLALSLVDLLLIAAARRVVR